MITSHSIDQHPNGVTMPIHSTKPAQFRPRPEDYGSGPAELRPTGEGGNVSSRLAAVIGPNGLLATALLLSAVLVGLTTAALN
jgi:hypothetical protein